MMLFALQEHVQEHAAEAAEKFDAGKTIIEHVSNSGLDHPLLHLPTIAGINFSVTKHVLMLWLVSAFVFILLSWTVRRYSRQVQPVPSGFANALEFLVEWIRDSKFQRAQESRKDAVALVTKPAAFPLDNLREQRVFVEHDRLRVVNAQVLERHRPQVRDLERAQSFGRGVE